MNDRRYGNNNYWCFIPDGFDHKEIAIWHGPEGKEEIIARAKDKYDAKFILDALLNYVSIEDTTKFGKKETAFLEFVCSNCPEPYATMAQNAILWNDREQYNQLVAKFSEIYK